MPETFPVSDWVLAAMAGAAVAEMVFHLPFGAVAGKALSTARKATSIIRSSSISDHWKERVIFTYALIILMESLKLMGLLLVFLSPLLIAGGGSFYFGGDFFGFIVTTEGLFLITVISIVFFIVRTRFVGN